MIAIGIDVSKSKLDIFYNGNSCSIPNNQKSIKKFFKEKALLASDCKIVLESTGKYHRLSHKSLVELGCQVMVINPFQSRNFAKSMNVICKTDAIDAKILALYAEKMEFKSSTLATEEGLLLQELSRHLEDLKQVKVDLEGRLRDSEGFIKKSLTKAIKTIKEQIKETEKKLDDRVSNNTSLSDKCAILESIPGIGHCTAIMLLSHLGELGTLSREKIIGLAGLAPINNDSGIFKGKRYVRGGRAGLRSKLFMPILGAATQHNKRLKIFYESLINKGKAKKVALVACMRKLIVWANFLLTTSKKWDENYAC